MSPEASAQELRAAYDRKQAHARRSLAVLRALTASLGQPKDAVVGHGLEWLLGSEIKPLVTVRCSNGHKLAGVWRTDAGGLFASWPAIAAGTESRSLKLIVAGANGSRRRAIVDLIGEHDPYAVDARLKVSCVCRGVRSLPVGTRARLAVAYEEVLSRRPTRFVLDEAVM